MTQHILDLHIHSKYSRACSKDLELPKIAAACAMRGITIAVTGDFTHPKWFAHMRENLVEMNEGVYQLASETVNQTDQLANGSTGQLATQFIIGTEVASIKKHKDQVRRVHLLLFAPNLEVAERFNNKLTSLDINLTADGRPIIGLTSKQILETMLGIDERMVMIPAHAWTPWFGVFGSKGGYDSLEDAFEELSPHIFAIETGLSSDPLMNWRCSWLDRITLISNSDAHSLQKLGREANVMRFEHEPDVTYDEIFRIIREGDSKRFAHTIEFYPEEGKYHLDGHRDCSFVCTPEETKRYGDICPTCKKSLTIGVMNRVTALADRTDRQAREAARIPYKSLVPLPEIIANTLDVGVSSKQVQKMYQTLLNQIGNEFFVLIDALLEEVERVGGASLRTALDRVRRGEISIQPGYDGVFGSVSVFREGEQRGRPRQGGFDFL